MELTFKQLSRFVAFINKIEGETYPEAPMPQHTIITTQVLECILDQMGITPENRILDVGCGQGPALDYLREKGYLSAIGITLNDEDVNICRDNGHNVRKMDQSFLEFQDGSFDFVWARHVIEHSIFPYFTLTEYARALAPGGMLYLEIPAPGTPCHHETNPNHYSVLGHGNWVSLLGRSGFVIQHEGRYTFPIPMGMDEYWSFVCSKA
ncbi:MAG: class I SAM-dependent methyltransferase [Desulfuromonadales bacterium]